LITVSDLPLPTIDAGVDQEICDGESVTLSASSDSDFTWDNGVTDNVGFIPVTTTEYIATATNNNGCWNKDTVLVTVHSIPTAQTVNVSGPTAFCDGESVELSVAEETDMTYQWMEGESEIENQADFKYSAASSGNYKLKIASPDGCIFETLPVTVLVYPVPAAPTIAADGSTSICEGEDVELSVTDDTELSYQWTLNTGAVGIDSSSFTASLSGNYALEVVNSSGCITSSANSVDVVVETSPTVPSVIVDGETIFCPGNSVNLSVTNDPEMKYQWMNGENIIDGEVASTLLANVSGNYKLRVTNANSCTSESEAIVLTAHSLPSVSAGDDDEVCKGESVSLSATGDGTISWDNNVVNGVAFIPVATNEYHASTIDANGCTNEDTVVVTVNDIPIIDAGADKEICNGEGVVLVATGETGFIWDDDIENGVVFYPDDTKDYRVSVETDAGCANADTVTVGMYPSYEYEETEIICEGVMLNWRGQVVSKTGTYTDSYTSVYGCDSIYKMILNVSANPSAFEITGEDEVASGSTETYNVPLNGDLTYGWEVINGSIIYYKANNIADVQWNEAGAGAVYVVAQNTFGCQSETAVLTVEIVTGIENAFASSISVYPNPNSEKLYIETPGNNDETRIRLIDITGKVISANNYYNSKVIELKMDSYTSGIYFLNIRTEEGDVTFKVVKEF